MWPRWMTAAARMAVLALAIYVVYLLVGGPAEVSTHPPSPEGILHSNHATLLASEQNIVVGSLLRKCLIFQGKAAYLSLPPARLLIRDLGITIIE